MIGIEAFVQYGLLGLVLGWFMWRNEKILTKLIDKIDELCSLERKKLE